MKEYTTVELKGMAFDVIRQIQLLTEKRNEIVQELAARNELIKSVEVTPDVRNKDNT